MKRLALLAVVFLNCINLLAQEPETGEYEASFTVRIRDGVNNHNGGCTNKYEMFTTLTGQAEQNSWYVDLNPIGTSWKNIPVKKMTIPIDKKLTKIRFRGERNWKNLFNCKGNSGWDEFNLSYNGCYKNTYTNRIPHWTSQLDLSIYPKQINLYYYNRAGQREVSGSRYYLPQSHQIQVKATAGFPNVIYGWQYQIGSGSWLDFPSTLYSNNTLTFSGNDIPNINFINDVLLQGKNIKVRISYGCGGYSGIITLIPLLSSPDITAADGIAPTCSYFNDGKIEVTFSRALYTGETVSFTLDGVRQTPENISVLLPGNKFVLEGFASFTNRVLSIKGRFNGLDTYTDDPSTQSKTVTVPVREPVVFTATKYDVHCFEGEDGKIEVTAQGGTQSYTSYLVQGSDTLQTIALSQSAGNTFTDLKAGTYTVKIRDSYQCDSKDGNGNIITLDRAVDQPVQKVLLSTVENMEPLGFGLKNGHVTVRAESGTYPYTFDWTDEINHVGLTGDAPVTEGNSMKSTLSNIGKGKYRVVAKDNQYALALPQTEVNIRGCYDTLTIFVEEPPLLEVALEEQHFVSCYGYTDGEVVAHAKGGRPYLAGHTYEPYQYEWFVVDNAGGTTAFGESDSTALQRPSAFYRVKITDRNGIIAWSPDFKLVQPDELKINFKTSQLLCNGDTNGTSEALPQGGTQPYRYAWSTDETTRSISNLSDGWYSVVIVDTRGCTTFGQTEVVVPNSLAAEAVVIAPTCNGYTDGSIALTVTGGKTDYEYKWQHGPVTSSVTELGHGIYTVVVTDANGCFITREYSLDNPGLFALDLGPDRVLCRDQVLELNTTSEDPASQYIWKKDGQSFASSASVTLSDAGKYSVSVTDSKGCFNQDEITITRDDTEIAASLAVATRVPQGGKVRVANISHPAPDRVEWIVPAQATVLEETPEYLELIFQEKGEYPVSIRSFKGQCEKISTSTVRVVDKSELTDYKTPDEPYIKQFAVTPNPNDGHFKATIELREAGAVKLILYANQSNIIREDQVTGKAFIEMDYDVSSITGSGLYMLQLITAQGQSTYKVMINK